MKLWTRCFCYGFRVFLLFFFLLGAGAGIYPADDFPRGDAAMAERYALWAKDKMDQGLWAEALAGLERASDFANVSSDVSFLLAVARSHEKKPRGTVLEALNHALAVNRWNACKSEDARFLRAETLIAVRAYPEALNELSMTGEGPKKAELTLKILAASRPWDFLPFMSAALDRYPRESGPVRVFFNFLKGENAAGRNPEKEEIELLELIIRRLPALLLNDHELAWIAAPFMRDTAEAKRLVEAYRAAHKPLPASLPAALRLGVIDETLALEELFAFSGGEPSGIGAAPSAARPAEEAGKVLDMALLSEIRELLRHEGARELFRRNLSAYSGVITEDAERDGIPESSAEYHAGMAARYSYDADQDGSPDLTIHFEAGNPLWALSLVPPVSPRGTETALVRWERYPAVLEAELDGARYIPGPGEFYFSPVSFVDLWNSGLLLPRRDPLVPSLTRRILVFNALRIERPSSEFKGGRELVELARGIPILAREYLEERMVSETEFLRGRPQLQRVDLDLDGRMETGRFFNRNYPEAELEELWDYDRDDFYSISDWDGDGIYESSDNSP